MITKMDEVVVEKDRMVAEKDKRIAEKDEAIQRLEVSADNKPRDRCMVQCTTHN